MVTFMWRTLSSVPRRLSSRRWAMPGGIAPAKPMARPKPQASRRVSDPKGAPHAGVRAPRSRVHRFVECFLEHAGTFKDGFFRNGQGRSDLDGGGTEADGSKHEQSFLEAQPNHLKREIGIRLLGAGQDTQDASDQALAMHVADLGKAALDLAQTPVQQRTHDAR